MANKAFLEIGGFDSYDTLKLEMPEIGVLFENVSHCINAQSNKELIEELRKVDKKDSKVRIIQNSKTIEYQVALSKLEDENSYILTFSDITAIHNSLSMDIHTGLPRKNFILEKIDILKQKTDKLLVILVSIKHSESIEKFYGKKSQLEVESDFSKELKRIISSDMPNSFLGHFEKNQFIIIPDNDDYQILCEHIKDINVSAFDAIANTTMIHQDFNFTGTVKIEHLNTSKDLQGIEVDITNAFEI
ncbi:MAG: hypothetical protein Q9M34_04115, partial [Sulfurimonas sp.]|nr:hypothetical protein [Sulfurimonas sp.]